MKVTYYYNKRNEHKKLEVHSDGYGHTSVRQFMNPGKGIINKLGDGNLHRWKRDNLNELLKDYERI